MKVLISIDVEVWCNSWETLDVDFPSAFNRYVYGRSKAGEYGLPKTLELLNRHGLKAVFFVEPLFAARFGLEHLAVIVELIRSANQEVQLHLHPEWTDEARTPLLPYVPGKRQHLFQYSLEEQRELIGHGLRMLDEVGQKEVTAFRAGSFACNRATYSALADNGLLIDSSINPTLSISGGGVEGRERFAPYRIGDVSTYPMSAFMDGFGRTRHAQVGACSYAEMEAALLATEQSGWECFVLLSHNFELLKPDSMRPDPIVAKRFARLCEFLGASCPDLVTSTIADLPACDKSRNYVLPKVGRIVTGWRMLEQLACRMP